jgi:hypothetical protein
LLIKVTVAGAATLLPEKVNETVGIGFVSSFLHDRKANKNVKIAKEIVFFR